MVHSLMETGARAFVTRFLGNFISNGSLAVVEDGGPTFTFEGTNERCKSRTVLKVHHPQFYCKLMTGASMGLADAYIDGDFSVDDEDDGLLNLFTVLIANRDANKYNSSMKKKRVLSVWFRGWWTALLLTASVKSTKLLIEHILRRNSLTQARRNISRHYDLSNDFFALILGESMTYSSGIYKAKEEDLTTGQLRKNTMLIEKARIANEHKVLEIGSGWGTFAIEVVRQTGCKYTGITLSKEQLEYAEAKVRELGLQSHIRFLLCDYRELSGINTYDRIVSCEMIEHVGHEYMEEFFGCCDSLLAEDGLFVIQFSSIPDDRYEEYRKSTDFIKEYIFPGACVPSLSCVTTAMAAGSTFSVEYVENIGSHYYDTLRQWRKNLLENRSKILNMGYDEKFIRTWEYYFDYCAAGFKSYTLANYQVVFSRPGNRVALGDPYKNFPSANK